MPMTATFTPNATAPSATVLPHTSAISSCGSATISTEPTRAALTTTGTSRLAIGAAISAANHAGTRSCRVTAPTGGWGRRRGAGAPMHQIAHGAQGPQLRAEVGEDFLRRPLLLHEGDRLAHEQLGELHRRGDFDPRGRACLKDCHGARHQSRDHID